MSLPLSLSKALADYIGAGTCATCHQQEWRDWQKSDHQHSMAEANESTVLGNFDGAEILYGDILSKFSERDGKFYVTTDNSAGEMEEFEITHTFGWQPLQQYLISFEDGRKQVLNLAWDTRPETDGGQRWFNLYTEDDIEAGDLLHWTSFPFTWNTSCAACHSTNLEKNYHPQTNSFDTSSSEINVACEACHGEGSEHVSWVTNQNSNIDNSGFPWSLETAGGWIFENNGNSIATRVGVPEKEPPFEQQVCAQCHSLRTELQPFHGSYHDAFQISPIEEPMYHIDGQIREEVFVMGSFMQSRMHDMGVTCSNCHQPHSLELLAEPNQVCAQCHLPSVYDTTEHHFHPPESTGAVCVDCHMPASNFMQIDGRRDHNIRVPRPDLSETFDSPNACNQCHTDESIEWATEYFNQWWPNVGNHYAQSLIESDQSRSTRLSRMFSVLSEPDTNSVARSRLLQEIAETGTQTALNAIRRYSRSDSVVERQGAVSALSNFPIAQTQSLLLPLLEDEFLSVRLAATRQLATLDSAQLSAEQQENLSQAVAEALDILESQQDSPGIALQLSALYSSLGDADNALKAVTQALRIAPDWMPALINQASIYSGMGNEDAAGASLRRAISANPDQADPYYALGLSQIRMGERSSALVNLERASRLAPNNPHYHYVYAVALYESGQTDQAVTEISKTYRSNPNQIYIGVAAASYQIQMGQIEEAKETSELLEHYASDDAQVRQIAEYLRQFP